MRLKASIVFLGMCFSQLSLAEEVKVVATIKPLQLIAADIVGDTGRVDVLIPPGASPHHYSMKPSDRRKLDEAGLVAWVGPDLETFLVKTLSHSSAPIVAMMADEAESDHADEGHEGHGGHTDHDDHKEGDAAKEVDSLGMMFVVAASTEVGLSRLLLALLLSPAPSEEDGDTVVGGDGGSGMVIVFACM